MDGRRTSFRRWLLGSGAAAAVVLGVAAGTLWNRRTHIAHDLLAREFARRGVPAHFRIVSVGVRTEELADIVIGDPARPDLTVSQASVRLNVGAGGVSLSGVEARGLRLRGRYADGRLRLGALDRLMPASRPGAPPALPAIRLRISDARARIVTPAGVFGLAVEGSGRLDDGFEGRIALVAHVMAAGSCTAAELGGVLHLATEAGASLLDGPLGARSLACAGSIAMQPAAQIDARIGAKFDSWHGGARLAAASLSLPSLHLDRPAAQIGFSGRAQRTLIGVDAQAAALATDKVRGSLLDMSGKLVLAGGAASGSVHASLAGASAGHAILASAMSVADAGAGTPLAPLAGALSRAATAALSRFDLSGDVGYTTGGEARVILSNVELRSASGARLAMDRGSRLSLGRAGMGLAGGVHLAGGGFPAARIGRGDGGDWLLTVAPLVAPGARAVLAPVHLRPGAHGVAVDTSVTVDGPLGAGSVRGLTAPLHLLISQGAVTLATGCTPLGWRRVEVATLALDPGSVTFCSTPGQPLGRFGNGMQEAQASLRPVELAGTLGSNPLVVSAAGGTLALDPMRFALRTVSVRLGAAGTLMLSGLNGRFAGGELGGDLSGADATLAAVPIRLAEGRGAWTWARGVLSVAGLSARVLDRAPTPRFRSVSLARGRLSLRNGIVEAAGSLLGPRDAQIADLSLRHDLGDGRGVAILQATGLTFGSGLQPEQVTPLTLGVIADVSGTIRGDGRIAWSPAGVVSSGTFRSDRLNLAAAFGPVTGIGGTIRFDDLLGMHTPPGQEVTIASLNPGIEVTDGRLRFQLLGPTRVRVEEGHWPLAGGTLTLEPTDLDLGLSATKRFTLRVTALDAARFLQQMELDNIAVTGIFDGALPLAFNGTDGRIIGGRLVARPGGGTLSYVGEVSNAQLGTFGKLAFDALKSLRYRSMAIDLDGALGGEVVSRLDVSGVNQQPVGAGRLGKGMTGLPFRFNITVAAPFRGLMNSARSFSDPSVLLHGSAAAPVQPPASAAGPESRPR